MQKVRKRNTGPKAFKLKRRYDPRDWVPMFLQNNGKEWNLDSYGFLEEVEFKVMEHPQYEPAPVLRFFLMAGELPE